MTTANQTYQADVQITNQESNTVNADSNTVNALTNSVTIADGIAGVAGLVAAVFAEFAAVECVSFGCYASDSSCGHQQPRRLPPHWA